MWAGARRATAASGDALRDERDKGEAKGRQDHSHHEAPLPENLEQHLARRDGEHAQTHADERRLGQEAEKAEEGRERHRGREEPVRRDVPVAVKAAGEKGRPLAARVLRRRARAPRHVDDAESDDEQLPDERDGVD